MTSLAGIAAFSFLRKDKETESYSRAERQTKRGERGSPTAVPALFFVQRRKFFSIGEVFAGFSLREKTRKRGRGGEKTKKRACNLRFCVLQCGRVEKGEAETPFTEVEKMIRIAVVEDDPAEADRLNGYIEAYAQKHACELSVCRCKNGLEFLEKANKSFDIVFLDIEMPLMDGLEAAKRFRRSDNTACLIFVTKMAQLAVKGYEVNAMDFRIKPVRDFEFEFKIGKALAYCAALPKDEIAIENRKGFYRIELSKIVYIEVFGHDLLFHTTEKNVEAHGALKDYEAKFAPKYFSRIAKSYLVNLKYVASYSHGEIGLANGEKLLVSRAFKKTFANDLSRYLGEIYK